MICQFCGLLDKSADGFFLQEMLHLIHDANPAFVASNNVYKKARVPPTPPRARSKCPDQPFSLSDSPVVSRTAPAPISTFTPPRLPTLSSSLSPVLSKASLQDSPPPPDSKLRGTAKIALFRQAAETGGEASPPDSWLRGAVNTGVSGRDDEAVQSLLQLQEASDMTTRPYIDVLESGDEIRRFLTFFRTTDNVREMIIRFLQEKR